VEGQDAAANRTPVRLTALSAGPRVVFPFIRFGDAVELRLLLPFFPPDAAPFAFRPDASISIRDSEVRLGSVPMPAGEFIEVRIDWHTSGAASLWADRQLLGYQNAVAPGLQLSLRDIVVRGPIPAPVPLLIPRYSVAKVFVRALRRADSLLTTMRLVGGLTVPAEGLLERCVRLRTRELLRLCDQLRALASLGVAQLTAPGDATSDTLQTSFSAQAIAARHRALDTYRQFVAMVQSRDYSAADSFLDSYTALLEILHEALPSEFEALVHEHLATSVEPEECRAVAEAIVDANPTVLGPLITLLNDMGDRLKAEMRFFEEEHFYPVSLEQYTGQVEVEFGRWPESVREDFRLQLPIRSGDIAIVQTFDPPVLLEPDNFTVFTPDGIRLVGAVKVLHSGPLDGALEGPEVDAETVLTHGTSFRASDKYFGPLRTISGAAVAAPGDPYKPSLIPITVIATFVNLLEALRYELLAEEAEDYPPDGLRGGLDIAPSLFSPFGGAEGFPDYSRPAVLALIEAQLANDPAAFNAALRDLPLGWTFNKDAWDALTRFAFVEYYSLYAFNDFNRYQAVGNEHEGDDEGCCLVFERNALNAAAASGSEDVLLDVTPHSILTSVHEEFQDADLHQFLPAGTTRDDLDLIVWIAAGSHATYLSAGTRDLLDLSDVYEEAEEAVLVAVALAPLLSLQLAILALLADLFVDIVDRTSDDGVHTGPRDIVGDDPTFIPTQVEMLDMSANRHIYQPAQRDLLGRRAYAGKLGGQDDFINHSPPFRPKTGRYFRRLLKALD
jgi:hypothetical protein